VQSLRKLNGLKHIGTGRKATRDHAYV
jgi:hypothetical protein